MHKPLLDKLLTSEEPAIRYKTRVQILKENPHAPAIVSLQEEIRHSPRVQRLLSGRTLDGQLEPVDHPYHKWYGAHWVLVHLAEIGYPAGDRALLPLREQVYWCWLSEKMQRLVPCQDVSQVYRARGVPVIQGRARRCASQQAKRDAALTSAILRAASVFLRRNLLRRRSSGQVIDAEFCKLHYPCYWHYDLLFGLKILTEAGFLHDSRCAEALDLLEQKALPGGGWTTDGRAYYRVGKPGAPPGRNSDKVSWGKQKGSPLNEWVTLDALYVLNEAHRVKL